GYPLCPLRAASARRFAGAIQVRAAIVVLSPRGHGKNSILYRCSAIAIAKGISVFERGPRAAGRRPALRSAPLRAAADAHQRSEDLFRNHSLLPCPKIDWLWRRLSSLRVGTTSHSPGRIL